VNLEQVSGLAVLTESSLAACAGNVSSSTDVRPGRAGAVAQLNYGGLDKDLSGGPLSLGRYRSQFTPV